MAPEAQTERDQCHLKSGGRCRLGTARARARVCVCWGWGGGSIARRLQAALAIGPGERSHWPSPCSGTLPWGNAGVMRGRAPSQQRGRPGEQALCHRQLDNGPRCPWPLSPPHPSANIPVCSCPASPPPPHEGHHQDPSTATSTLFHGNPRTSLPRAPTLAEHMPPSPSTTGKAPAVSWDSSLWVQPRAGVPLPWGPQATALGRAGWRLQALPLARNTLHTSGPHFLLGPCGSGKELGLRGLSPEVCGARRGRRRASVCAGGGGRGGVGVS